MSVIKNVGVLGAGTMGLGIAQSAAIAGYKVQIHDKIHGQSANAISIITENLQKGVDIGKIEQANMAQALGQISVIDNLDELKADLVIEAIIEDFEAKEALFAELEHVISENTIICTNTSSISVTKLASCIHNKKRFLGMHFFNPAHIMKLVEVISGPDTNDEVLSLANSFVSSMGKTPVMVKDAPGFIVNRVARHFYVESLRILEEQVASVEDIDKLVEATGFRMGPFRLMDLIGVDTNFAVTSTVYKGFHQEAKFRPSRIQEQMVDAGYYGRKSGRGFYSYE
jgi:3-hydroxybutyryl-CoA dehydrogenase